LEDDEEFDEDIVPQESWTLNVFQSSRRSQDLTDPHSTNQVLEYPRHNIIRKNNT
jgi:hypothetical protein